MPGMRSFYLSLVLFVPLAVPAFANTPKEAFNALNACARTGKSGECREEVTASSAGLYDRFASYGLTKCLPKDVSFVSQSKSGAYSVVRASTEALGGQKRYMRFYFVQEEGRWKLDVPESLRVSMGENWESQVNAAEQVYLALNSQFGGQMGCQAVQGVVGRQAQR